MKRKGKLLIVDDSEDILISLSLLLKPLLDEVRVTTDPSQIERFYKSMQPDVVLLDMNFQRDSVSGEEGYDWLGRILKLDPEAVVILMTAYSDTEKTVKAIKSGAADFVTKPWDNTRLLSSLFAAIRLREERTHAKAVEQRMQTLGTTSSQIDFIGESPAMKGVNQVLKRVGPTDANILILGENGTGKDVAARLLCRYSMRSAKPFVSIDLGSLPENLFESELFGYEKGAFTDACQSKAGRLEAASGGTLFLDEIGNLTPAMQGKLLTVLEQRQTCRLGSNRSTDIDVRLVCATNADLHRLVRQGCFRQDLLFRINTIEITLPPLRERGNDILLLAEHFIKMYAHKYGKNVRGLTSDGCRRLMDYPWPGNVRELRHSVERAILMTDRRMLNSQDFILSTSNKDYVHEDLQGELNLERVEQQTIRRALEKAGGNITEAARLLGITRYALYRKMK